MNDTRKTLKETRSTGAQEKASSREAASVPRPRSRPKAPRHRCGHNEYFDSVVGLCSRCEEICQPSKTEYFHCQKLCPGYVYHVSGSTSNTQFPLSDWLHMPRPGDGIQQIQDHTFISDHVSHTRPEYTYVHFVLPWMVMAAILIPLLSLVTYKYYKSLKMRERPSPPSVERTRLLVSDNNVNGWRTANVSTNLPVAVVAYSTNDYPRAQRNEDDLPKSSPPPEKAKLCSCQSKQGPVAHKTWVSQEMPSTLLSLHEDPDPRGPQFSEGNRPVSLRETSYHGSDAVSSMDMNVPTDLPKPEAGGRHISKIMYRLEWVVEYSSEGGLWKIILCPEASLDRAKMLIERHTGLSPSKYQLGTLGNSSFEPQGIGDVKEENGGERTRCGDSVFRGGGPESGVENRRYDASGRAGERNDGKIEEIRGVMRCGKERSQTIRTSAPVTRIPLAIGDKIQRALFDKQSKQFVPWSTPIGAFFTVVAKNSEQTVCAFTNCESATDDTQCFVRCSYDNREYILGRPIATVGGNWSVDRFCPGSDQTEVDTVYLDGMLVPIDLNIFAPSNTVMYKGKSIKVNKFEVCVAELEGRAVNKLLPEIAPIPDGFIRCVNKTNKIKHKFTNSLEVTTMGPLRRGISKSGGCGTIISSVPENGRVFLYGALFGLFSMEYKTEVGINVKEEYTAVYPLNELFKCMLDRYEHTFASIELYNDESANEQMVESGIATGISS